jgi:5-(carboxyamino)imidazole ribonucleotide mutase
MPTVLVVMGSDSDAPTLAPAWEALGELGIGCEVRVASAHRTPEVVRELALGARAAGHGVIIAAAGGAAHLAGVFAAHTTLPVVAVPIPGGTLGGLDALLASAQMPAGVPVATVAIGGARNAGLLAAQILGVGDAALAARLEAQRAALAVRVREADARLHAEIAPGKKA